MSYSIFYFRIFIIFFSFFKIIRTFEIYDFFSHWKLFEFSKLEIYEILLIQKFSEFLQFGKLLKFQKLTYFGIVCPFDISHHSQFCLFSYLPFDINSSQFLFSILVTFVSSAFKHSFFLKFETSAILKFLKIH